MSELSRLIAMQVRFHDVSQAAIHIPLSTGSSPAAGTVAGYTAADAQGRKGSCAGAATEAQRGQCNYHRSVEAAEAEAIPAFARSIALPAEPGGAVRLLPDSEPDRRGKVRHMGRTVVVTASAHVAEVVSLGTVRSLIGHYCRCDGERARRRRSSSTM
jgi:hypothetical protein